MKWIGIFIGIPVLLIAIMFVIGLRVPEDHTETLVIESTKPQEMIWKVLTDYAAIPSWWPEVKSNEKEVRPDGSEVWWTTSKSGFKIALETTEEVQPSKLVRRVAQDELPFGGSWTFELTAAPQGTRITITEKSTIKMPVLRFFSRYVVGYRGTLENYGKHFEAHLNSTP